jgi:hypothetical protein
MKTSAIAITVVLGALLGALLPACADEQCPWSMEAMANPQCNQKVRKEIIETYKSDPQFANATIHSLTDNEFAVDRLKIARGQETWTQVCAETRSAANTLQSMGIKGDYYFPPECKGK